MELTVDADVQLITGLTLTVTFESRGSSAVEAQAVPFGGTAEMPDDPMRSGALFTGWYTTPGCTVDNRVRFFLPPLREIPPCTRAGSFPTPTAS